MLWSHLILNRHKKYLAVLSFQVIKAEIRMADGKVAVQMNGQKSLVFRGEECNYKNVYRVLRLMDSLDGCFWTLSHGLYISQPGEPERQEREHKGRVMICRVLPIPHSGACTSLASSRNIGLDRRGCSIVVGWTTISYRSTLLFLCVGSGVPLPAFRWKRLLGFCHQEPMPPF